MKYDFMSLNEIGAVGLFGISGESIYKSLQ